MNDGGGVITSSRYMMNVIPTRLVRQPSHGAAGLGATQARLPCDVPGIQLIVATVSVHDPDGVVRGRRRESSSEPTEDVRGRLRGRLSRAPAAQRPWNPRCVSAAPAAKQET